MKNVSLFAMIFIMMGLSCSCVMFREIRVSKYRLKPNDYRLFQKTKAWPLAKAVWDEDLDEIEELVKQKKIPVDLQESRFSHSLLAQAILNGHYDSVEKLLELGANPNLSMKDGQTPMLYTVTPFVSDIKFLKLLLRHGASLGPAKDGQQTTPLMGACRHSGRLEHVKLLVDAGADMNYRNKYGFGSLAFAIAHDNMDVVLYLLKRGAKYDYVFSVVNGKNFTYKMNCV